MKTCEIGGKDSEYNMIQLIDISEHKKCEKAIADKEFASMINATVSHEMRGPINSI